MFEELKVPKDIELKFHRLGTPNLNNICLPLSGLYSPIDNEESPEYILKNKFKNFDISPNNFLNIENLLTINNNFGKICINEQLEGLLMFENKAEYEVSIKIIEINIKLDENKSNAKQPLEIDIPKKMITIQSKRAYQLKIKTQINFVSKYKIDISFNLYSLNYDQTYYKIKQRTIVKERSDNYSIKNGCVEYNILKKLTFESYNPFKINEFFYNSQVNKCFIEIRILNNFTLPLSILDIYLTPKNKKNDKNEKIEKIPLAQSLQEIKMNNNSKNLSDSKYLTLQTDEQIRVLFCINDTNLFYDVNKFTLNISWLNYFNFIPRLYTFEFSNKLNTYNEYYKMIITEKPNEDIVLNQNFKIIINLQSKNLSKKYSITLSQEPIKDNDVSTDREIEIIDIIEKKMELNSKTPSNNFVLICKSDILGNVYLPKLKFSLYEGDKNTPIENVYDALLNFNCISKI